MPAATRQSTPEQPPSQSERVGLYAVLSMLTARGLHAPEHAHRVAELARACADALELGPAETEEVVEVARVHELGKIAVPDTILLKATPLTDAERAQLCQHPLIGAQILSSIAELAHLAPAVEALHEQWDGAGYPHGLAGEEIPLASRIVLICDAYEAMLAARPYRPALTPAQAEDVLRQNTGTQFCPRAAAGLLSVLSPETPPAPASPQPVGSGSPEPDHVVAEVLNRGAAPPAPPIPVGGSAPPEATAPRPTDRRRRRTRSELIGPRIGLWALLGTTAIGIALGLLWALPMPNVDARCPAASEGQVQCVLTKAWLPMLTKVEIAIIVCVAIVHLIVVTIPRWRRGELRRRRPAWSADKDPVLAAASWTLTYGDAHPPRRWRPVGAQLRRESHPGRASTPSRAGALPPAGP